jgi:hypothetical protein
MILEHRRTGVSVAKYGDNIVLGRFDERGIGVGIAPLWRLGGGS